MYNRTQTQLNMLKFFKKHGAESKIKISSKIVVQYMIKVAKHKNAVHILQLYMQYCAIC